MTGVGTDSVARGPRGVLADLRPRPDRLAQKRTWPIAGADELFRSLYTGFEIRSGTSLAVCSAVSGEGKSTICTGLAVAIAQDLPDRRVVIVETDLWRPVFAKDFGLPPAPGLADCLLDRQPLATALRATDLDNLSLLLAGSTVPSPQRLLRSARMADVMNTLRNTYDVVIVDTAAVMVHSEVALIARMVEEVVFVVRTGVTPARELDAALGRLREANVKGIVLNDVRSSVPRVLRRLVRL
jgi:capsular exopolysaccharide synthesis family protein